MNKSGQGGSQLIGSKGDHGYNAPPAKGQQGQVKASSPQQGDNASRGQPVKQPAQQNQQQDKAGQQQAGKKQSAEQEHKKS